MPWMIEYQIEWSLHIPDRMTSDVVVSDPKQFSTILCFWKEEITINTRTREFRMCINTNQFKKEVKILGSDDESWFLGVVSDLFTTILNTTEKTGLYLQSNHNKRKSVTKRVIPTDGIR